MHSLLYESLAPVFDEYVQNHEQMPYVRHGVSGDFFNIKYFEAWLKLISEDFEIGMFDGTSKIFQLPYLQAPWSQK